MSAITKKELYNLYYVKRLTQEEVGRTVSVCRQSVQYWIKKYGIKSRSRSDAQKIRQRKWRENIISKRSFIELYKDKKLTSYQIARLLGISQRAVLNWLIRYNVKRRPSASNPADISFDHTPTLAYILGVIAGDGSVYQYTSGKTHSRVSLGVIDKEFALSFKKALGKVGFNPVFYSFQPKGNRKRAYMVQGNSKTFVEWYKNLSTKEKQRIIFRSIESTRGFIRGMYESEGTFRPRYRELRMSNTDKSLLELCNKILLKRRYSTTFSGPHKSQGNRKPYYRLYITGGLANQLKFIKEMNPCIKRGGI